MGAGERLAALRQAVDVGRGPLRVAAQVVEGALAALRERGVRTLAADGTGRTALPDADLTGPHCWVMGNEAWGLDAEVRERCDDVVRVPIHGRAESLNLAMAATICLYASAGQHDGGGSAG